MIHGIDTGILVSAEVEEHPHHAASREMIATLLAAGDQLAVTVEVLSEFIHIATDPKRFQTPLSVVTARDLAQKWWTAKDVIQVFVDVDTVKQFFDWHRTHDLGRKRILDTMIGAAYRSAGISSILTTNPRDFKILGGFNCITI